MANSPMAKKSLKQINKYILSSEKETTASRKCPLRVSELSKQNYIIIIIIIPSTVRLKISRTLATDPLLPFLRSTTHLVYTEKGGDAVKYRFVFDGRRWGVTEEPRAQLAELAGPHHCCLATLPDEACRCHLQKSKNVNAAKK